MVCSRGKSEERVEPPIDWHQLSLEVEPTHCQQRFQGIFRLLEMQVVGTQGSQIEHFVLPGTQVPMKEMLARSCIEKWTRLTAWRMRKCILALLITTSVSRPSRRLSTSASGITDGIVDLFGLRSLSVEGLLKFRRNNHWENGTGDIYPLPLAQNQKGLGYVLQPRNGAYAVDQLLNINIPNREWVGM
jgi:hypothetical protein